jgi:hypothetical protein
MMRQNIIYLLEYCFFDKHVKEDNNITINKKLNKLSLKQREHLNIICLKDRPNGLVFVYKDGSCKNYLY